jgi:hypothetical protein
MTLSTAPRLLKAALAVVDPDNGSIRQVIPFQFNPERLSRKIMARDIDPEGDPMQLVRLSGPPRESLSFEAIMDATDALDQGSSAEISSGLASRLAALEMLISPTSKSLISADKLADQGALELLPAPPALTLLIWNANRVSPVRLRDLSIEEELFDQNLNPLRARLTLTVEVLSSDDLGVGTKGGGVYLAALAGQERLAKAFKPATTTTASVESL